ncbi:MAG: DUF2934 domain-containing protein [Phycisphaerales bacterium]|nr:DUF2934 domain-containing protein [Phycisphaerales bacterium]
MLATATRRSRSSPRSKPVEELIPTLSGPTEEEIRERAYQIFISRGGTPGNPEWDWQQAELELRARFALLGRP